MQGVFPLMMETTQQFENVLFSSNQTNTDADLTFMTFLWTFLDAGIFFISFGAFISCSVIKCRQREMGTKNEKTYLLDDKNVRMSIPVSGNTEFFDKDFEKKLEKTEKEAIFVIFKNKKLKIWGMFGVLIFRLIVTIWSSIDEIANLAYSYGVKKQSFLEYFASFHEICCLFYCFSNWINLISSALTSFRQICCKKSSFLHSWVIRPLNAIGLGFIEVYSVIFPMCGVGFLFIYLPYALINNISVIPIFEYFNLPRYIIRCVFIFIELSFLFQIKFIFPHFTLPFMFVSLYSLFLTFGVQTTLLSKYPYDGLLSFNDNWWTILIKNAFIFLFFVPFLILYVILFLRRKLVTSIQKKSLLAKNNSKNEFGELNEVKFD